MADELRRYLVHRGTGSDETAVEALRFLDKQPLGVLHAIWDRWDETADRVRDKGNHHFIDVIIIQFVEILEHSAAGDTESMANELVDIISVTLNWMRSIGLSAQDVATAIKRRGDNRYDGQAQEILDKYRDTYGV